jgi:hypothetical protein
MKGFVFLIVGFVVSITALNLERGSSVCNVKSLDPTIMNIVSDVLPSKMLNDYLNSVVIDFKSDKVYPWTSAYGALMNLLSIRLPIISFISNGYFRVEYEKPMESFSFNDIYLIQENYASLNFVCNTFGNVLGSMSPICKCWSGQPYENILEHQDPSVYHHKAQWCVIKPSCTDKSLESGYCTVPTDPIRNSCILLDTKNYLRTEDKHQSYEDLVTYTRVIPTMDNVYTALSSLIPSINVEKDSLLARVNENFIKILSYFPTHLVLFLLGEFAFGYSCWYFLL